MIKSSLASQLPGPNDDSEETNVEGGAEEPEEIWEKGHCRIYLNTIMFWECKEWNLNTFSKYNIINVARLLDLKTNYPYKRFMNKEKKKEKWLL